MEASQCYRKQVSRYKHDNHELCCETLLAGGTPRDNVLTMVLNRVGIKGGQALLPDEPRHG